jgi:hypothetical protein
MRNILEINELSKTYENGFSALSKLGRKPSSKS